MSYSDDPIADYLSHEALQNSKRYPVCSCCSEEILDESAYCIDGDWYCEECIENFRTEVDPEDD